jgi:hypothetical protein
MGFSSHLCSKTKQSIPAFPYADLPKELSEIVVILPDDSQFEGFYDGYGKIHAREDFQAYCTRETSSKYHEDQAKAIELWDLVARAMKSRADHSFDDFYNSLRIVVKSNYNGEKFADLAKSESCPDQGYFYEYYTRAHLLNKLIKSLESSN